MMTTARTQRWFLSGLFALCGSVASAQPAAPAPTPGTPPAQGVPAHANEKPQSKHAPATAPQTSPAAPAQGPAAAPAPSAAPAQSPAAPAAPPASAQAPSAAAPATQAGPAPQEAPAGAPAASTAEGGASGAAAAGAPSQSAPALNPYASGTPAPMDRAQAERIARERANVQQMLAQARAAHGSGPAREPEPRRHGDAGAAFGIGLSVETPWYTDAGYDAFDDNNVATRLGAWLSADLVSLRKDAIMAVELGWNTEHQQGEVLGSAATELSAQSVYAGATLRWVPLDWLQPHARIAAGTGFIDVQLRTDGQVFHDGAGGLFKDLISPFGSLGLGATLRTPTRTFEDREGRLAAFSLGLMVEGGYTLAAPVDVKLDGPGPDARGIATSEASFGQLDRSGPYVRLSLVCRL